MEKYSYNQAEAEAELIRKKAIESKENREDCGEPENIDYTIAEKQLESVPVFLREGREKWIETVKNYWANYKENKEIELKAVEDSDNQDIDDNKLNELIAQFHMGAGRVHHRLASTLTIFLKELSSNGFYSDEQLEVLEKIINNSTENGKVNRFSKETVGEKNHPVIKLYENIINSDSMIDNDEFEKLKNETLAAGYDAAILFSVDELLSWFYWSNGQKHIEDGEHVPSLMLGYFQNSSLISEEEKEMLEETGLEIRAMQSGKDISPTEKTELRQQSKLAREKWEKFCLSNKFSPCQSFLDYLDK